MITTHSRFTFSSTSYTTTPDTSNTISLPLQCAHLQDKHVLLVVVPESVVMHVVPEEPEGLLLFPALQGRRGRREVERLRWGRREVKRLWWGGGRWRGCGGEGGRWRGCGGEGGR